MSKNKKRIDGSLEGLERSQKPPSKHPIKESNNPYTHYLSERLLISTFLMVISGYLALIFLIYCFILLISMKSSLLFIYFILFWICCTIALFSANTRDTLKNEMWYYEHYPRYRDTINPLSTIRDDIDNDKINKDIEKIRKKVLFWDLLGHQEALKEKAKSTSKRIHSESNLLEKGTHPDADLHWCVLQYKSSIHTYILLPEDIMDLDLSRSLRTDLSFRFTPSTPFSAKLCTQYFNDSLSEGYRILKNVFYLPEDISKKTLQSVEDIIILDKITAIIESIEELIRTYGKRFKINPYLELRLIRKRSNNDRTMIYVDGEQFMQCKYLLLNIPEDEVEKTWDIKNIDEAAEIYSHDHELKKVSIDPETEFFGHCSNLQAWAENDYNTNLLHRNLAFPLLKELAEAGDPKAKKRFREEIAKRLIEGDEKGRQYLIKNEYLKYLTSSEMSTVINQNPLKNRLNNAREHINFLIKKERTLNYQDKTTVSFIFMEPSELLHFIYPDIKEINNIDALNSLEKGDRSEGVV